MVELAGDELPAAVLRAHEVRGRDAYAVVVGGGRGDAAHGPDRRPGEAGGVRGHQDDRYAAVLGGVGVRAAGEPDPVGLLGVAGEDLLAVDDPVVAVPYGAGPQRRQVRPGLGLAVADREDEVAAEDAGQEVRLLLLGPVRHQGRADRVQGDHGDGGARPVRLVEEDELLVWPAALAAVLLRPPEPEQAVAADPAEEPSLIGRRSPRDRALPVLGPAVTSPRPLAHQRTEVGTEFSPEPLLAFRRGEMHERCLQSCGRDTSARSPPTSRRSTAPRTNVPDCPSDSGDCQGADSPRESSGEPPRGLPFDGSGPTPRKARHRPRGDRPDEATHRRRLTGEPRGPELPRAHRANSSPAPGSPSRMTKGG